MSKENQECNFCKLAICERCKAAWLIDPKVKEFIVEGSEMILETCPECDKMFAIRDIEHYFKRYQEPEPLVLERNEERLKEEMYARIDEFLEKRKG
jgi:hypothetical protein